MTHEALARVRIDTLLAAQGWDTQDKNAVRFEVMLPDGKRADCVLCDRHGRSPAVVEAKRHAVDPGDAATQARRYAEQLRVPFVFLSNGAELRCWDCEREAYPPAPSRPSSSRTTWNAAPRQLRRDPMTLPVDCRIIERDCQIDCIDTLCREIGQERRKLLVEMATGTGKTRTAATLIERLFEAQGITRVLFPVDRIPLAKQAEDAFAEHLPEYPAYVLRAGRRFEDQKLITITTLQGMVNLYTGCSIGCFDLVVSDECRRSICGPWSGVLKHFDGVQIGLTATPSRPRTAATTKTGLSCATRCASWRSTGPPSSAS